MDKTFVLKSVLIGTLLVVCLCGCGNNTSKYVSAEGSITDTTEEIKETEAMESSQVSEKVDKEESLLYVYVCGEVEKPGVYTLPPGSRVCDVFEIAGGFTKDAATDYWNQARLLTDGEMIYVPTIEEAEERGVSAGDDLGTFVQNDDEEGKVNINTASRSELMTIPGIGEAKADAIIAYRQANGSFSTIEEVKNVEGIKDGVFTKMKEYIVIN